MLGHMACRVLSRRHTVVASCRRPYDALPALAHVIARADCIDALDLTAPGAPDRVVEKARADVVFNCAGLIVQKDEVRDPVRAIRANALLPHQLAQACDRTGAKLITVSTDCVFSGRRGGYRESDVPDPVDGYGRSKLLGEVTAPPHLTLRCSVIGRQLSGNEGLFEWFLAQRGGRVSGFAASVYSGVTTRALCEIVDAATERHPGLHGLYHLASRPISKFELLRRIDECMGLGIEVEEDRTVRCDRSLDGGRLERDTGLRPPPWDEMLQQLTEESSRYDDWRHPA